MALLLIFGAVTHQRHTASSRELLHQSQRKLLTMVLNGSTALVDGAIKEELLSVFAGELLARDSLFLAGAQKSLARTQIGHPDVVPRC